VPYPNKHPFEIISKVSKEDLRPIIDERLPLSLTNILKQTWDHNPAGRPNCQQVLQMLNAACTEFNANKEKWTMQYYNIGTGGLLSTKQRTPKTQFSNPLNTSLTRHYSLPQFNKN